MEKAREYAIAGKTFLETHVPGGLERARKAPIFSMDNDGYCMLANASRGQVLNGVHCHSAVHVGHAFAGMHLNDPRLGFYAATENSGFPPVEYRHLQVAWEEVLGRSKFCKAI